MSDENYYLTVEKELEEKNIDNALWSKATALSKGNEDRIRSEYIILRVQVLKNEALEFERKKQIKFSKKVLGFIAGIAFLYFLILQYNEYMRELVRYEGLVCLTYLEEQEYRTYFIIKGRRYDKNKGIEGAYYVEQSIFPSKKSSIWSANWKEYGYKTKTTDTLLSVITKVSYRFSAIGSDPDEIEIGKNEIAKANEYSYRALSNGKYFRCSSHEPKYIYDLRKNE